MNTKSVFLVASLLVSGHVLASPLAGASASAPPSIAGSSNILDFEDQPNATFSSLASHGVTISGVGGALRTDDTYAGNYNGRGTRYLDNNAGRTSTIRFDFLTPVSAFAFNWGASDVAWTLSAFSASGSLIESITTPITNASNAGDYIGLRDAGISYATLTSQSPASQDWIFIDNLVSVSAAVVPEPGVDALLGLGVLGLIAASRRRRPLVAA